MSASVIAEQKFFGLVELDKEGTVLFSRIERDDEQLFPAANITGCNFYSEVVPFSNVEEFHNCLDSFFRSSQQANSFLFTCEYKDGPLQVKVLLARVRERSADNMMKSMLVHIRKAQ